jgi:hypothetical protein
MTVLEGPKVPSMRDYADLCPKTSPRLTQLHAKVFVSHQNKVIKTWSTVDTGAARTVITEGMVRLAGYHGAMEKADASFDCAAGKAQYAGKLSNMYLRVHPSLCFLLHDVYVIPNPKPYILVGMDVCHFYHPSVPWKGI